MAVHLTVHSEGEELLDKLFVQHEAKIANQQERLKLNQRRLKEYEGTIRGLYEKLEESAVKDSAIFEDLDEEDEKINIKEGEMQSLLRQSLRSGRIEELERHMASLVEHNKKLLEELQSEKQIVARMKKGSISGIKVDGQDSTIKSLEKKLNEKTEETIILYDKIEELEKNIELFQKQVEDRDTEHIENAEEDDLEVAFVDAINDPGNITNWLGKGVIELKLKRINMLGPPGSGKTCSQRLLLNEDPPEDVTNSTPIACRAVKATRISCHSKDAWERIGSEALLEKLASDLAAYIKKHQEPANNQQQGESMAHVNISLESSVAADASESIDNQNLLHIWAEVIKMGERCENPIHLNRSWVYIIDSGGQPAFQELLPLFVRRASLNIVTLDLSKGVDQPLECNYRLDGETFRMDSFLASNREFFKKVVCSGDMCPSNQPLPKEDTKCAAQPIMHFVLGTHFDKVTDEDFKKVNDALTDELSKSSSEDRVYYYKENDQMICHVNTLIPKGEERSQISKKISKFISNCVSRKLRMPIRWFAFDLFLQMEAKNKNSSYLKIRDVLSIGRSLEMSEDDTKEALEYLHEVTIILYYPQVLPDMVFVDPCTILDTLTRLLALTYIDRSSFDIILKEDEEISNPEVKNLSNKGLFTLDVFQKLPDIPGFSKSDLVKLLCRLHIIAETERGYFIPSALRCYNGPSLTEDIQPLVIVWLNQDNKNLLVPQGIFCSVIVRLINEKELKFSMPDSPSNGSFIYRNAMSFQIENEGYVGTLHFINKYKHIELYFTGHNPAKHCPLISKLVIKAITESSKKIRVDEGKPVPAFACPETEGCYCLVIDEENESSHCTFPKSAEVIKGQKSYWNWFHAPRQNNSEVCHTHLDIRQLNEVNTSLSDALFHTSEWVRLGDKLGLYNTTFDIIKDNNPNNVEACLREMLVKWLEKADNASVVTWSSLVKALEDINQKAVAEKIRCQLQKKSTIAD